MRNTILHRLRRRRPPVGRVRFFLIHQSLGTLIALWLSLYALIAILFGVEYRFLGHLGPAIANHQSSFGDALHFSFTTQATVGYGDIAPLGATRILAAIQGCLGMILNAVAFGMVTYRFVRHPVEIEFSRHIAYDPRDHLFWLRWNLLDEDDLRETAVQFEIIRPIAAGPYDVSADRIALATGGRGKWTPSIHLMALKTQTNRGINPTPPAYLPEHVVICPLDIVEGCLLELSISGQMHSTGDAVFTGKKYFHSDVRCGSFSDFDNFKNREREKKERYRRIKAIFNPIAPTSETFCRTCPFFEKRCPLNVATRIRDRENTKDREVHSQF